jgi:transcriptional regulator GlxA family with amidase domain
MRNVVFLVMPEVVMLDLAGPLQVFQEAAKRGTGVTIRVCSTAPEVRTDQGLLLAGLAGLPAVSEVDLVIVPGTRSLAEQPVRGEPLDWLSRARAAGATVCSVCSGAFLLADAGLLSGRQCTTHWSRVDDLQRRDPSARVLANRLFVEEEGVVTSAGITSGVDMALWLVERSEGPLAAAAIAREMVVYLRRDGAHEQRSVYLDYRTHMHPGVHVVQDWLIAHPAERTTLERLGRLAGMSARNLTRVFRQATGISVHEFVTKVRLELARTLLCDPGRTIDAVAAECGFEDVRQFRRLWQRAHGAPPSAFRRSSA